MIIYYSSTIRIRTILHFKYTADNTITPPRRSLKHQTPKEIQCSPYIPPPPPFPPYHPPSIARQPTLHHTHHISEPQISDFGPPPTSGCWTGAGRPLPAGLGRTDRPPQNTLPNNFPFIYCIEQILIDVLSTPIYSTSSILAGYKEVANNLSVV